MNTTTIEEEYAIIERNLKDSTQHQHVEKALQAIIPLVATASADSLLSLLIQCSEHSNRFVREGVYDVICAALVKAPAGWECDRLAALLRYGLADNWSQVRYAASRATRSFMVEVTKQPAKWYPTLLPPLCLNRHYIADGVRNYTMETWRMVVGLKGKDLIAQNMSSVVEYYEVQAEADNHAVREAACQCICETAMRIDKDAVRPFVPRLLRTLLSAFNDESWPVRDVACLSSSAFVEQFPSECEGFLEELYPLWLYQCGDPIPSVRTHAATALGNVLRGYKEPVRVKLLPLMEEMLHAVELQKAEISASTYSNVTTFAVAKRVHDNDEAVHVDQTMYSCGSLAPRMNKGSARPKFCGCSGGGAGLKRTDDPWFMTDCAVYLLKEWGTIYPADVAKWAPQIVKIVECTQFVHHVKLWCSVYQCLPSILQALKDFPDEQSKLLSGMTPKMFEAISCGNELAAFAAAQCILDLQKENLLGFNDKLSEPHQQLMKTDPIFRK
jgi:hypothetical protein